LQGDFKESLSKEASADPKESKSRLDPNEDSAAKVAVALTDSPDVNESVSKTEGEDLNVVMDATDSPDVKKSVSKAQGEALIGNSEALTPVELNNDCSDDSPKITPKEKYKTNCNLISPADFPNFLCVLCVLSELWFWGTKFTRPNALLWHNSFGSVFPVARLGKFYERNCELKGVI
jgi:hypothetical protein